MTPEQIALIESDLEIAGRTFLPHLPTSALSEIDRARHRCRHHAADLLADLRAARERIADLEGQLAMRGTP